ncbi:metal-dependent hydrolase [Paenibacillus senegalensis]|uniref:metal-dependent hydrolase n=1 Tax=Paenibacillus senegalensis TaxID=1465766 RepID=UPI0002882CBC|nr:metal-dependent hydrolase [Paenibacillus senegalensis]
MDTATHFVIGLGLGAMAHLSPEVAANPALGLAITIGTVVASEAPDSDFLYKIKGTSAYLKNHRRWTHSIPAWFVWPTFITFGLSLTFQGIPWGLVWLWCFAAVLVHVGTDILNTFGAVPLLPFSKKRLSFDVLQVFDPVLFISQLLGLVLWWSGAASPGPLFLGINSFTVIYIAARCLFRRKAELVVAREIKGQSNARYSLMPTFHLTNWKAVIETADGFRLGTIRHGRFEEDMKLNSASEPSVRVNIEPLTRLISHRDISETFFSIAKHIYREVEVHDNRIRVILTDLRFRYGQYFPFRAVFELDGEGTLLSERLCSKSDMRLGIGVQESPGFVSTS